MDLNKFLAGFYDYATSPVIDLKTKKKEERMPPAYISDKADWVEKLASTGGIVDGYFLYATTLSVLQSQGASVSCSVFVVNVENNEFIDQNATLRFDQGVIPRLCGLSRDFELEEEVESGDYEIDSDSPVPLSRAMERELIRQLGLCIKKQFQDPMFRDRLSKDEQNGINSKFKSL